MELLSVSVSGCTIIWVVMTVIVAVIPIWALQVLWLKPKKMENLLRAQGLQGQPYKLDLFCAELKQNYMLKLQHEANSKPITLSNDVAPDVFLSPHQAVLKYGKNSFLWEGRKPKVIITNPEEIKQVFNKMQDYPKPKLSSIAKFFSVGLIEYEGEKWAKHRKIISPAFHPDKLKSMLPAFLKSSQDMISKWKEMLASKDGTTCEIDVWPFLQDLTCDAISRTAFGSSYAEGTKIFELLKRQGYLLMKAQYAHIIPILMFLPTATNRMMKEINRNISDSVVSIIKKREQAMKNGEATNIDFLGLVLESNHSENQGHGNSKINGGMTDQDVIEECKLFYLAGQETTANLLVWTMVLLARHPEWQARARQEVLQVFGNQNPNNDGLSHLKIMTMILYEVLRLYPPAIYFNRVVPEDLKLGDLSLPAGTHISIPILLIHHDNDIWGDDAKEFKPERFSEGIAKATKGQLSYFPFGWGPRMCIGQNFSLLEAKRLNSTFGPPRFKNVQY
ncbi:11-oxo-beta-amyrin 30-oxidase-like [Lotus japonicus]|uniref:11-oxo-beta-amyrin 30-oxidase-like n=1 Tax=Lotus japonicus TaxID=34305 RepID=UPI0025851B10|nr:11-oxo-beta-amyrin 30-oxidase-like [Lotus japonicus]